MHTRIYTAVCLAIAALLVSAAAAQADTRLPLPRARHEIKVMEHPSMTRGLFSHLTTRRCRREAANRVSCRVREFVPGGYDQFRFYVLLHPAQITIRAPGFGVIGQHRI